MSLFQIIENEQAILSNAGLYIQTDLYKLDGVLYAKLGSGFVRLYADSSTSKPKVRLVRLTGPVDLKRTPNNHLCLPETDRATDLNGHHRSVILGENPC